MLAYPPEDLWSRVQANGRLDVSGASRQELTIFSPPTSCMKRKFSNCQAAIESS